MLGHAYILGLVDGQRAVGTKRGGKRIGEYFDDKRQSPRPSGQPTLICRRDRALAITEHGQETLLIFQHGQLPVRLDDHENINTRRKLMLRQPPCLTHATADGISFHCGATFFCNRYGHSGGPGICPPQDAGHQRFVPPTVARFIYHINKFFPGKATRF